MLFSTIGQIYVFLWMVGAGVLIGLLYALSAAVRRLLSAGFWLSLLIDAITGLGTGLILFFALVTGNYGQLRLYELLGACAGVLLFTTGIRLPAQQVLSHICRGFRRIFDRIIRSRPIKVIFR